MMKVQSKHGMYATLRRRNKLRMGFLPSVRKEQGEREEGRGKKLFDAPLQLSSDWIGWKI
jgi:hypothetical protein